MSVNLRQLQRRVRLGRFLVYCGTTGLAIAGSGAVGCATSQNGLQERVAKTAADLRANNVEALYQAHHLSIQAELDRATFAERVANNPREVAELAGALETSGKATTHTAEVTLRSGDKVILLVESGRWVVHEGPFGAVDLSTPWAALRALRAALRNESLGSLRTLLGGQLRAKRDFALQMLLEQTEDVHALKFTHDEATGVFRESATFETPSGVHIVFVREGERWYLEHVQAPHEGD